MKLHHTVATLLIGGSTLLAGCASTAPQPYANTQTQAVNSGTIESIDVTRESSGSSGAGVVAGGLIGGLLGNQVGSGSGRTAATLAGAVGGAMVGNEVENKRAPANDVYRINLRLDNGDYRTITQDNINDLRVGNRVRVMNGRVVRY